MVDIKLKSEGTIEIMKVTGEVDASSSIELDQAIGDVLESKDSHLIVDCTDLKYISSAGLGVFMSYIEEFKQKDRQMAIFGLNPKVRNVFEILGLDQLLTIRETEAEAKSAVL